MKIPLSWLKEYIDLPYPPTHIADVLTSLGLEVDKIEVSDKNDEAVFEISLTPNLTHCASLVGIARELSAATGHAVRFPQIECKEEQTKSIHTKVKVVVEDPKKCPRYACRLVENVRIAPSPEWMQNRLNACGIRPINNIVDITNYVLLELGHPLHAFDFDQLDAGQIIVREAKEGESFITLDEKERILSKDDLLICDHSKGVAIAGVMGAANSEVTEKTVNVLIESAYFQPQSIRKTSKKLGLQTEASKRFERGADPNGVIVALDRAAMWMQELAQGTILIGIIDIKSTSFEKKTIPCRLSRINRILGTRLSVNEVELIFHRLEMHSQWDGQDTFTVTVPTYRGDVNQEIDLIEEIARVYGYDNLDKTESRYHGSLLPNPPIFLFEREMRSRSIAEGLQEFITCDLIGPKDIEVVQDLSFPPEASVKVLNPTSIDQSILRTSLLPGLLQTVKYNIDHQTRDICGFEIGRVHFREGENQYKEQSVIGIVLSGNAMPSMWDLKAREVDFFDLKGILENILQEIGIQNVDFRSKQLNTLHSGRQASIYVGDLEVGSFGEVHPAILRRLDVSQRIFFAELNLHDLIKVRSGVQKMEVVPIYPGSERDWTMTVREDIPIQSIFDAIKSIPSHFLESVSLLDIYRSDKIGKEMKNVTLHFIYRDNQRTIEQDVVDKEHARLTTESLKHIQEINHLKN
jgi:phenylalanyl-tRNA synthetase beta chain